MGRRLDSNKGTFPVSRASHLSYGLPHSQNHDLAAGTVRYGYGTVHGPGGRGFEFRGTPPRRPMSTKLPEARALVGGASLSGYGYGHGR